MPSSIPSIAILILALWCQSISSFSCKFGRLVSTVSRTSTTSTGISMGGGRSPAEVGLSKRQLFRNIRDKVNAAAEIPGFFDVGEGKPEIELYCKSNKDGTQVGDCPFAQFVQLVLLSKGIRYTVKPTLVTAKPAWIEEKHGGKLPLIVHKDVVVTDSLAIAEYIEKTFPYSSLTRQGTYSYQEVLEKTSGFFPALKAFILNKDVAQDPPLQAAVESQLDLLDEIIRSTPGQYVCGLEKTLADLYLVPQLFHALVALEHFKGVVYYHLESDPTRPALENYVSRQFESEDFNNKKAYYSVDEVVSGWKTARGEA